MIVDARDFYQAGLKQAADGNYDGAEYYLLKSIEIDSQASTYATLGWLYASRTNRYLDAMRVFRKAIRLAPHDGDLYNDFGALLIKMGQPQDALKWFYKAMKSNVCTRQHYALYNMALIYRSWNRPERSRRYLNLCLRHQPDFKIARELLFKIEEEFQKA